MSNNLANTRISQTVTIGYCYGDHESLVSRHYTDEQQEAISRAVKKHFGKRAGFYINAELSTPTTKYGQIGHPCATGGISLDTGRVWVTVD